MDIATLHRRFPILARACVASIEPDSTSETVPAFIGIFLSVMQSAQPRAVCFVLPKCGDIPRLATVLYGLHRFVSIQPELTRTYGDTAFRSGDFVRVCPSKHVFVFDGFDRSFPTLIRLLPPGGAVSGADVWRIPAAKFVPRLERTTSTWPAGRMNLPIHDPPPVPIDQLLETTTFGNQALFRNEVVLLDTIAGLREFLGSTTIRPATLTGPFPSLERLVPCGDLVRPSGSNASWMRKWDEGNPTGEPLVAVTSSTQVLSDFCLEAPSLTKLVVANGPSRMKDLQAFDDVQATQRLVLFADQSEHEFVEMLNQRGCLVWNVTAAELDAGCVDRPTFRGFSGKLRVWARNGETLRLEAEVCQNRGLDDLAIDLQRLPRAARDTDSPVTKLAGRIWGILNDTATLVGPLTSAGRERRLLQLERFRAELRANRQWISQDIEETLVRTAASLEAILRAPGSVGGSKRIALDQCLRECRGNGQTCAVVVRTEIQVSELREWVGRGTMVCTWRDVNEESQFDRVICTSWPTTDVMEQIAGSLASSRVTVLAYPFEGRWLNQCAERLNKRRNKHGLGTAAKEALLQGQEPADVGLPEGGVSDTGPRDSDMDEDVWEFEQRLRAARKGSAAIPSDAADAVPSRYVSFVGETYAFLTETHRVVVATDLLSSMGRSKQRLPEKVVAELRKGDFIVFPESGERELIQEKADQLLGSEATALRAIARLWKEALRASQLSPPEFLRQATDLGRPRHIMTIRNWFAETSQIGPGLGDKDLSEDLELVALVTDYEPLKAQLPKVREAIKRLRSAHLSAGIRLREILIQRLPDVVGKVEEEGTVIDLGELGSAWIVQVESVAPSTEPRERNEVNQLLWETQPGGGAEIDF